MKTPRLTTGLVALAVLFGTVVAQQHHAVADDVYQVVIKKQETKAKSRWSLQDWLDTKDRIRMMDLWLAFHSPSPYEFYLGGNYQFNQSTGSYQAFQAYFGAYASIFGLEGRYESAMDAALPYTRLYGTFLFRFFGYHYQGTNITLHLGLRQQREAAVDVRNVYFGPGLTFYFSKFFGIEGFYRYYFGSVPNSALLDLGGSWAIQGGAFLDFSFLRIYGNYFLDSENRVTAGGAAQPFPRRGVQAGIKLFF